MQTFFINQKPVILGTPQETQLINREWSQLPQLRDPAPAQLPALLKTLDEESTGGYVLLLENPSQIFSILVAQFSVWQAAGGLVTNESGEILLMFRRGKWDLPKGKAESGESPEETALREVTEETGLKNIQIVKKLTETWHSYPLSVYKNQPLENDSKDILKQTFWYEMSFMGSELTIPQIEEDIIDIQWIKPENIEKYLQYTYPNIRQVFRAAGYL